MAIAGGGLVLAGVALFLGLLAAGVLVLLGLSAATWAWFRQRRRFLARRLRPADLRGRALFIAVVMALVVLGWR